jgi:type IV secretory pathway VirB10-like protein
MSFFTNLLFGKKKKAPTSPLLGSTAAQLEKAKAEFAAGPEAPPELPVETDPDILEQQRQARRKASKRKGLASTIRRGRRHSGLTGPNERTRP